MMNKLTPESVWQEYSKDKAYKNTLDLYNKVKRHEKFYIGDQWYEVNAPDLEKPVLNFVKHVVNYLMSVLVVNDVGISFKNFIPNSKKMMKEDEYIPLQGEIIKTEEDRINEQMLINEVERVNENVKFRAKLRELLHNGTVTGDMCIYARYNPEIDDYSQPTSGEIECEIVDNINVAFGNPYTPEVEKQPYIIIIKKELTKELRKQYPEFASEIKPDNEDNYNNEEKSEDETTTVLIRFYKENGKLCFTEGTKDVFFYEPVRTEQTLYPVAYMNWEKQKDCYHGASAMEFMIPNQIAVNKLWAMAIIYAKNNALPKTFYDKTKITKWTNDAAAAIGVIGDPNQSVASSFRAYDMSAQLFAIVNNTVDMSKNFMGANSAALGEVRPDNTSAIIALQKSSAAPLELQRLGLYQFIEDYVRIIYDIIKSNYGLRYVVDVTDDGTEIARLVDFSELSINSQLIVDVGPSDYWSELAQTVTIDNLFAKGIITDAVTYLESIPEKQINNKNKLIAELKEQQQRMAQSAMVGEIPAEVTDG